MTTRRETQRRLGRPPRSDSTVTRERILLLARQAFAELGYGAATNKHLAVEAGLTTGALYHYFESKFDIYLAVHQDVQDVVYERFNRAIGGATTFVGAIEAVLEAAHALNNEDPTLASFLGSLRIDTERHPELAAAFEPFARVRQQFFDDLVEVGIATGEIDEGDRAQVAALLRVMLIGLTDAVSYDRQVHRDAIDGLKALLEGKLIRALSHPSAVFVSPDRPVVDVCGDKNGGPVPSGHATGR